MPKCISCNEVYADQLRRCPHCGYTAEPIPQESHASRPAARSGRRLRVGRIAIVAVVSAIAGLAAVVCWPSARPPAIDDLVPRPTSIPEDESDPLDLPKPEEIEAAPIERDFQVTEARLEGDEVVVTGTCSARAVVEVRVSGQRATILRDGTRFVARFPVAGDAVEVVATGIRGDRATLRKEVLRASEGEGTGEEVRLVSHADGATVHVPIVTVNYVSRSGPATARTIELPLPNVENRIRIERSRFVLYSAPDGLVYLRTTRKGNRTFLRKIDDQEMVLVPGGVSWRGMGDGEPNGPKHLVELSPFLIDRTEVTCAQWSRFLHAIRSGQGIRRHPEDPGIDPRPVGWTGEDPPPGTEGLPVTGISWYSAWSYARWAGGRLPTESEWERAAAGPMGLAYPWGDTFDARLCRVQAAGPLVADSLVDYAGFYDLLNATGNVREWCLDRFDPRWYARGSRKNPRGPARTLHRVVRGGSFLSPPEALRLQFRDHCEPAKKAADIGFRVARPWESVASSDGD